MHRLIFGDEPGELTQRFLKNLSYAFFGVAGASLVTFGFNVLAVRFIGPEQFGTVNLIISAGELLVIPMLWGLQNAATRYLAAQKEKSEQIVGTIFRGVLVITIIWALIFWAFQSIISVWLKIPAVVFNWALLYAITAAFFNLGQSFLQGLEKFKLFSLVWLASAGVFVLMVLLYLFYFQFRTFDVLFFSNLARMIFVLVVVLILFAPLLRSFDWQIGCELFQYGSYHMISSLVGFFSLANIDNLMINYYLGSSAVGLYAAYYVVYNIFINKIQSTFSQVFLPFASGQQDVGNMFNHWVQLVKKTGIFIFAGGFILNWLLFKFYGNRFQFDWRLGTLMSINLTLYFFLAILGNIIGSIGISGARRGVFYASSCSIVNVGLNILLIPRFGLIGAVAGTIAALAVVLILAIYDIKFRFIPNGTRH